MIRDQVVRLKEELRPLENPYFRALHDGSMTKAEFVESQIQFFAAVRYFWRPMALLAHRLPDAAHRRVLLENIADEQGRGDATASHEHTFRTLLERLGAGVSEVEGRRPGPEVLAFNATLDGACAQGNIQNALAMLGMIEELFAGISADIGRCILMRGWLRPDQLIHYPAHEVLDLRHADGFFGLLGESAEATQGLQLGGFVFLRLYEDLHRRTGRSRVA
jgi:pyrroloquinoline-quinone synthase